MSYAVNNNYSNSSYLAEIFSRRTQENTNSTQENDKKTRQVHENAVANNESRAHSTEYPRPSMNALMFVEESANADNVQQEATAITEENTAQVAQVNEKTINYMYDDPNAVPGEIYNYTEGYTIATDWAKKEEDFKYTGILISYMDKYGIEEGERLFNQKYGHLEVIGYSKQNLADITERFALLNNQFKGAMRDVGLVPDLDTYYSLPQNPELLAQVQERFEERMTALGIEKKEVLNTEMIIDHENQVFHIKNKDTGEILETQEFTYWNESSKPTTTKADISEDVGEANTTSSLKEAYSLGLSYALGLDYLKSQESLALTKEFMAYADEHGVEEAQKMFKEKHGYDFFLSGSPARYNVDFQVAVTERTNLIQSEIYKAMEDLGIEPTKENYDALYEDEELLKQVEERLAERMSALGIEPTKSSGIPTINPETGDVTLNGEVIDKVIYL